MNHAQREELSGVKNAAADGAPSTDPDALTEDEQLAALTEAEQVATIIAQTSADLTGRPEGVIESELVERFTALGLDFSPEEARRVAHDISLAPKLRDLVDE